jgi:hypothetical protein
MSTKDTNPKDAIAMDKMPLHLVSGVVAAYQAIAHYLGNVKYGAWNYVACGARASIYFAAALRHLWRWYWGEENDPVDGTPHLANALACINILIETSERGIMLDDRPPKFDLGKVFEKLERLMPQIRERYKDRDPRHYTIADSATAASSDDDFAWVPAPRGGFQGIPRVLAHDTQIEAIVSADLDFQRTVRSAAREFDWTSRGVGSVLKYRVLK